jgi:hypothetical protein
MQTLRGAILLAVAVVVGVVLLRTAPNEASSVSTSRSPHTTLPRLPSPSSGGGPTTAGVAHQPSQVTVLVANGTRVTGAASRVKNVLLQAGYNTLAPTDATSTDATATAVEFAPGYQADAAAIASTLSLPASAAQPIPTPAPVSDTKGANVIVVVGTDLASQGAPPATAATPPVTSASHTATTSHSTTTASRRASTTTAEVTTTTTALPH